MPKLMQWTAIICVVLVTIHLVFKREQRLQASSTPILPHCSLQEIGVGSWDMTVVRTSPYCCLASNSQQKNCNANHNISAEMRRNQGAGNGCYCNVDAQYGPVWKPSANCMLEPWDPSVFCQRLGPKRLIFVGDSLADQFHITTFGMTHGERNLIDTCVDQLVFRLTDQFHLFAHDRGSKLQDIIAQETTHAVNLKQQPIFIVCVGAHLYFGPHIDLEQQLVANYNKLIIFAQQQFALNKAQYRFIPLTPTPPTCDIHLPNGRIEIRNVSTSFHFPYIHAMKRELYRLLPSELILPTFDALDQRPEAHSWWDCLHFCMPGPLQVLPIFLSHLMLVGKL